MEIQRGAGFISRFKEQALARAKERMSGLVDGFRTALERKEPGELARILKDVKALDAKGEKQFLLALGAKQGSGAPLKGNQAAGDSAARSLGDIVRSSLSPDQRQALARELMPSLVAKNARPEVLEKLLAKFLAGVGKQPHLIASMKDVMVRSSHFPPSVPAPAVTVPDPPGAPFPRPPQLCNYPGQPLPSREEIENWKANLPSREELEARLRNLPEEQRQLFSWIEHERTLSETARRESGLPSSLAEGEPPRPKTETD